MFSQKIMSLNKYTCGSKKLCPKNLYLKKICVPKYFGYQKYWSQNMWVQNKYRSPKKFVSTKICKNIGHNKYLYPKKYCVPNNCVSPKKIWVPKNVGPKYLWVPKIFVGQQNLCPKKIGSEKNMGPEKLCLPLPSLLMVFLSELCSPWPFMLLVF